MKNEMFLPVLPLMINYYEDWMDIEQSIMNCLLSNFHCVVMCKYNAVSGTETEIFYFGLEKRIMG